MSIPDGIICSIEGKSISKKEYSFFKQTSPLGFVLFSRNYSDKRQLSYLINELKNLTLNNSPFIFIDQEGGRVQRLKNSNFTKFPAQSFFGELYQKNKEKIANILDDRFCRMWEFYLLVSEYSFRNMGNMVFQMQITKNQESLPFTRNYMYN